ncbi:MAG: peptidylprolyl isomerase [Desulfobacteraceae bacterium]|nr:peptidylprolyl isomerase [Desulfobacteraceae bacterium]
MNNILGGYMRFWRFIGIIGILCVIAGCSSDKSGGLASINGKDVSKAEFDAYLKFKRVDTSNQKRVDAMLDQYLERKALVDVIKEKNLLDKALVEAELEDFRTQMYISRYFDKFLKDTVTNQSITNYYNTHEKDYSQEKARVAHILIRTNKKMSEPEREVRLTMAREAFSKIKKGEEFAQVAKEYSEDKISSKKGGDLGWIKKGSISKSFSEKVFSLKSDEVTEPFETPFGYHVVKLLDGPSTIKRPLEAVSGDIRYQLRAKAKKAEIERLMASIKINKK